LIDLYFVAQCFILSGLNDEAASKNVS